MGCSKQSIKKGWNMFLDPYGERIRKAKSMPRIPRNRTNHVANFPTFSQKKLEGYNCRLSHPRSGTYKCYRKRNAN